MGESRCAAGSGGVLSGGARRGRSLSLLAASFCLSVAERTSKFGPRSVQVAATNDRGRRSNWDRDRAANTRMQCGTPMQLLLCFLVV